MTLPMASTCSSRLATFKRPWLFRDVPPSHLATKGDTVDVLRRPDGRLRIVSRRPRSDAPRGPLSAHGDPAVGIAHVGLRVSMNFIAVIVSALVSAITPALSRLEMFPTAGGFAGLHDVRQA
jgi:hypothetical protein